MGGFFSLLDRRGRIIPCKNHGESITVFPAVRLFLLKSWCPLLTVDRTISYARSSAASYLARFFEIKAIFSRLTMGASSAIETQNDNKYEATRLPKYRISLKRKQTGRVQNSRSLTGGLALKPALRLRLEPFS